MEHCTPKFKVGQAVEHHLSDSFHTAWSDSHKLYPAFHITEVRETCIDAGWYVFYMGKNGEVVWEHDLQPAEQECGYLSAFAAGLQAFKDTIASLNAKS